jgi:molecular chaperone GrpE
MEDTLKKENESNTESPVMQDKELHACKTEVASLKNTLMRLTADFENARKNTEKELIRSKVLAQASILTDLVEIIDDFDRAFVDLAKQTEREKDGYYRGFELIYKAFSKLLTKYGVEEITENSIFDPELHEAVMQVVQENSTSGAIVEVLQKGYRYKGAVLRPAKVSVAQ